MDYKQKYLKYKTKYLQLKEQSGGLNWLTKKASDAVNYMGRKASDAANKISDKYECYMDNHSEICTSLLNKYKQLKIRNTSDIDIDNELKDTYIYKVQQHNTEMMKRETRKNNRPNNEYDMTNAISDIADLTQQRNKLSTIRPYYEYLSDCIQMKCIKINWNEYSGLIKFLESKLGHSIINLSFDDRNNNLEQIDYDKWNNPEEETKEETKEENNNNTTKENNDTKEENKGLSKKQKNDISTKGFSELPEPDTFILGGFSDWYHGTCNEIQLKINNMYKKLLNNYKKGDMYKPSEIMERYFRSIKIKSYELKKMTKEELEIYNEIKGYSCLWYLYKEKLLEKKKKFCKENDKLAEPNENVHDGGVMTAYHWVTRTCNEIHEKINAIYQNYKSKDENNADAQMGGEFTRIRTKYFILKNKEIMTQDEIDIYNEIKQYDFNWNKYKKKLEEKNFCEEKKK